MSVKRVIAIGGGPAGIMAALAAREAGCEAAVIEKNPFIGKKLRITGKGRCNLTNNCGEDEFIENVPTNGRFLYSAINAFTPADLIAFFEGLGVPLKTERGKRVFPASDKAADVTAALERALKNAGVRVIKDAAHHLSIEGGRIAGVHGKERFYPADAVIVATGGLSYPLTGSTGDGYGLAQSAGHTIVKPYPSLVPLETAESWPAALSGLSLKNVSVKLSKQGKCLYEDFGELLFTHFGVSGPVILSLSAHIPKEGAPGCAVFIDLKPALSREKLDARLLREIEAQKNAEMKTLLRRLLPGGLPEVVCEAAGIDGALKANSLTREGRLSIADALKGLCLNIAGTRPIEEAIITCGGVKTAEIDPKTMQSKLVKGLYFAGEVIDVSAYTGGFNLQIAFSTGRLAGISAGQS